MMPGASALMWVSSLASALFIPCERVVQLHQERHSMCCGADAAAMPAWMSLLHGSIAADATPLYARLFLVKAVLHVEARHTARMAAAAEPAEVRLLHISSRYTS